MGFFAQALREQVGSRNPGYGSFAGPRPHAIYESNFATKMLSVRSINSSLCSCLVKLGLTPTQVL